MLGPRRSVLHSPRHCLERCMYACAAVCSPVGWMHRGQAMGWHASWHRAACCPRMRLCAPRSRHCPCCSGNCVRSLLASHLDARRPAKHQVVKIHGVDTRLLLRGGRCRRSPLCCRAWAALPQRQRLFKVRVTPVDRGAGRLLTRKDHSLAACRSPVPWQGKQDSQRVDEVADKKAS